MKRSGPEIPNPISSISKKSKPDPNRSDSISSVLSDDNLLYEIFKSVDARTLARNACVSRGWRVTARDERLWEMICTRHWAKTGQQKQMRPVVLALGGFRNLHSLYLVPLTRTPGPVSASSPAATSSSSSSAMWPCPSVAPRATKTRWGKDEVQLSLSLLSIRYFEKMNRGKGV